jgi:hypothetical protein
MKIDPNRDPYPWSAGGAVQTPSSRRAVLKGALSLMLGAVLPGLARAGADDGNGLWTVFQSPDAFLAEAFGSAPPPKVMVLDAATQTRIAAVFGRSYPQTQIRYWRANGRSAWILDDLGKAGYQLTTSGFVVKDQAIDFARVLIYRESRGEQVGEPSFLKKLAGSKLAGARIDKSIDNISGATLSVKMMERMAAAALVLDALAPA